MRKPTVSGYGGVYDRFVVGEHGGAVEWQPGTGSRYLLLVRYLSDEEAQLVGSASGDVAASVLTRSGWITLFVTNGSLHHESYVAEKLALTVYGKNNREEVLAVTALLNLVIGNEEYGVALHEELIERCGTPAAVRELGGRA